MSRAGTNIERMATSFACDGTAYKQETRSSSGSLVELETSQEVPPNCVPLRLASPAPPGARAVGFPVFSTRLSALRARLCHGGPRTPIPAPLCGRPRLCDEAGRKARHPQGSHREQWNCGRQGYPEHPAMVCSGAMPAMAEIREALTDVVTRDSLQVLRDIWQRQSRHLRGHVHPARPRRKCRVYSHGGRVC